MAKGSFSLEILFEAAAVDVLHDQVDSLCYFVVEGFVDLHNVGVIQAFNHFKLVNCYFFNFFIFSSNDFDRQLIITSIFRYLLLDVCFWLGSKAIELPVDVLDAGQLEFGFAFARFNN